MYNRWTVQVVGAQLYSVQPLYTLHGYIYSSARPDQGPAQCLGLGEGYRCQYN